MTLTNLPGVYFNEQTTVDPEYSQEYVPLFIIQNGNAITTLDNQIKKFTKYSDFYNITKDVSGLNNTNNIIKGVLNEAGISEFYVYSAKTDTADAFTNILKSTAHLEEITTVIYVEGVKSTTSNTLAAKITAIKNGLQDNENNGIFREGYIIPYGTVTDAVNNAEDTLPKAAAKAELLSITNGNGDGRICVVVPDSMSASVTGKCIGSDYDEEPGFTAINTLSLDNTYDFDATDMLDLVNNGILFARPERVQGVTQYRVNLGVTTSFKESSSDGLLVSRTIADEVLRRIKFVCQGYVKAKESETTAAELESEVSNIISEFVEEGSLVQDGTSISVTDAGNGIFNVNGTLHTIKSVIAIEVNTVLS